MHRCIKCQAEYQSSDILLKGCPDCGSKFFEYQQEGKSPQIEEAKGNRVETIMVREHGVYEVNLPSLMEDDSIIVSDEEGKYLIDINFLLKKMREK
ncbi:MAG TPA: Zn-ribbon containing protein [Methanobacteriaceae archaeon]|nr:Zn-ribbon containing protein [Methanobacteriaceae archaeon]